jgi:hypothetical protein
VEVDTDADAGEGVECTPELAGQSDCPAFSCGVVMLVSTSVPAQELPLLLPAPAPQILQPLLSPVIARPVSVRAGADAGAGDEVEVEDDADADAGEGVECTPELAGLSDCSDFRCGVVMLVSTSVPAQELPLLLPAPLILQPLLSPVIARPVSVRADADADADTGTDADEGDELELEVEVEDDADVGEGVECTPKLAGLSDCSAFSCGVVMLVSTSVTAQELPLLLPAPAPAPVPLILPPLLSPAIVGPVAVRAGAGAGAGI